MNDRIVVMSLWPVFFAHPVDIYLFSFSGSRVQIREKTL